MTTKWFLLCNIFPQTQEISTYYCGMSTSQNHHNTIEYMTSHLFTQKTTINEHEIKIIVEIEPLSHQTF